MELLMLRPTLSPSKSATRGFRNDRCHLSAIDKPGGTEQKRNAEGLSGRARQEVVHPVPPPQDRLGPASPRPSLPAVFPFGLDGAALLSLRLGSKASCQDTAWHLAVHAKAQSVHVSSTYSGPYRELSSETCVPPPPDEENNVEERFFSQPPWHLGLFPAQEKGKGKSSRGGGKHSPWGRR